MKEDWILPLFWDLNEDYDEAIIREDVFRLLRIYSKIANRTGGSIQEMREMKGRIAEAMDPKEIGLATADRELVHDALKIVFFGIRDLTNGKPEQVAYARQLLAAYKNYLITGETLTGDKV